MISGSFSFELAAEVCQHLQHLVGLLENDLLKGYLSQSLQVQHLDSLSLLVMLDLCLHLRVVEQCWTLFVLRGESAWKL